MRKFLPFAIGLFLSATATAEESRQLTWDLTVDGRKVGTREITIRELPNQEGIRMLEGWTEIEASALGLTYSYQQRLSGMAGPEPVAFHSVLSDQGEAREVQGRRTPRGWTVVVVDKGRERNLNLPRSRVDLSTVDLLDPESRYRLDRFEQVRVLSAETGDILEGRVQRLGPSEVSVAGQRVAVEGVALETTDGVGRFFYTADGWLVRFETKLLGRQVAGTLRAPPPLGRDEQPVGFEGDGVEEVEL